MNQTKHLQAVCSRCGRALRCLAEQIGTETRCPHCGQQAELMLAAPNLETSAPRKIVMASVIAIVVLVLSLVVCVIGLRYVESHQHHRQAPAGATTNLPSGDAK